MANVPFMQLYVGDYMADTGHLTTEQHGAYLLLLMAMWTAGGNLPNDPAKLARIARATPRKWPGIWDAIGGYFEAEDGVIVNPRLAREHAKAVAKSQIRADAGSRGGKAKALKTQEPALANATVLPQHLPEPEKSSVETNVSTAPEAPIPTTKELVWQHGKALLGAAGKSRDQAGRVIGKWVGAHGEAAVLEALDRCKREGAIDPVAFVEGALRWKAKQGQARAIPNMGDERTTPDGRTLRYGGSIDGWLEVVR